MKRVCPSKDGTSTICVSEEYVFLILTTMWSPHWSTMISDCLTPDQVIEGTYSFRAASFSILKSTTVLFNDPDDVIPTSTI